MRITSIVAITLCAALSLPAAADARQPLAKSNKGRWNAYLTPVKRSQKRITLGATARGRSNFVLVRGSAKGDFALMLQNKKTGQLSRSRSKQVFLSQDKAINRAQSEYIRLYESSNRYNGRDSIMKLPDVRGRAESPKILNLNGVRYKTIYHGVTRDGRAHIVEFKPGVDKSMPHQRRYDSKFINIDARTGTALADFTVPNSGKAKGRVAAYWLRNWSEALR
jgi:hypothetical protein